MSDLDPPPGSYQPDPHQPDPYQPDPYQPDPYYQQGPYSPEPYYQHGPYPPGLYQPTPHQRTPHQPDSYQSGSYLPDAYQTGGLLTPRPHADQAPPTRGPGPGLSGAPGVAARLGDRLLRRPEPRFGVGLAGAGAVLLLIGLALSSGDFMARANDLADTDRNLVGGALFAMAAALGFTMAARRRTGPLPTSGVVLAAFGVPAALAFLTFDAGSATPFDYDTVIWLSIVVYLASYFLIPGARGHTLFIVLIALFLDNWALLKIADSGVGARLDIDNGRSADAGFVFSNAGTVAVVSLLFGGAYYAIAWLLDNRGRHGPATGLLYPAVTATVSGLVVAERDLGQVGDGLLVVAVSAALCFYGGRFGRRFTCFFWSLGIVVGVGVIVADLTDDAAVAGLMFALTGLVVMIAAHQGAIRLREADDMDAAVVVRSR